MRSGWIRGLALALGFGLAVHACRGGEPEPERAYSVQLHLHGSFSEGLGSIDSHSYEAADVGCDVLWWSDHDFRITTYEHVTRFGFESWEEPLDRNEGWHTRLRKYQGDRKGARPLTPVRPDQDASFTDERASEGQHRSEERRVGKECRL